MSVLRSRPLERKLRAAARAELRLSPEGWREYRRRARRAWRWRLALVVLGGVVLLGAVWMPTIFSLMIVGLGAFATEGPMAGRNNGPALILAIHGLQATGALLLVAAASQRAYLVGAPPSSGVLAFPRQELRVMAHYPISDADLLRVGWWDAAAMAYILLAFSSIAYFFPAWKEKLWPAWGAVPAMLWLVHMATVVAAGIVAAAYAPTARRPRIALGAVGLALIVGGLFLGMAALMLPAWSQEIVRRTLYATPAGWTSAAYLHALFEGRPAGWAWLVPAGLTIVLGVAVARGMVRAGFAIREFLVSPADGQWYGVIGRGFRLPRELPPPPPLLANPRLASPPPTLASEANAAEPDAAEAVKAFETVATPSADRGMFLDRWSERFNTPRERVLLSVWSSYAQLTRQWWTLAATATLAVVALRLFEHGPADAEDQWVWLAQAPLIILLAGRGSWLGEGHPRVGARLIAPYPVHFDEVCWAAFKKNLVRCVAFLPVLAWYGWEAAGAVGLNRWQGVAVCALLTGLVVCAQPVVDCLKLSGRTNDTHHLWGWVFWLGGGGALLAAMLGVAALPWLAWKLAAFGLAAFISGAMSAWYRNAYRTGRFDLQR